MEPDRLEHLKMVQAAIGRMAQNSFLLKGWSVTLTTGILAAAITGKEPGFGLLALLPAVAFWGLDAFYLRQERLFRGLHDDVCAAYGNTPVDFSMDTATVSSRTTSWYRTLWAKTVVGLHGSLVGVILIVAALVHRAAVLSLLSCFAASFRS